MLSREIANQLDALALCLELSGANPFKVRAMTRGARIMRELQYLPALLEARNLTSVEGIGAGIAEQVYAWCEHGAMPELQALQREIPPGVIEMAAINGLGAKKVRLLWQQHGIDSLAMLQAACADGSLLAIKGFGQALVTKIQDGIALRERSRGKALWLEAQGWAHALRERLLCCSDVTQVAIVGALRRACPIIEALELVVQTDHPGEAQRCVEESPQNLPVQLHIADADNFAELVFAHTGSAAHQEACQQRAQDLGVVLADCDEQTAYQRLQLPYLAPELREAQLDLEGLTEANVPEPVLPTDVRGILHCHSTYSDGHNTLAEMREAAADRGWAYLGFSDHSQSARYAGGLSPERVQEQAAAIAALNTEGHAVQLFHGIESDILGDGSLDYDDAVLAQFDYVIASIHGQFSMPKAEMTKRICTALRHPAVRILAHPTGRLLLTRDPYAVDLEEVLRVAGGEGVVVEINCAPKRSELDWELGELARRYEVQTLISPDAHSVEALEYVDYGARLATKGGWPADAVINTWERERLRAWLKN